MSARALVTHAPDPVTAELARQVAEVIADRWIEVDVASFDLVDGLEDYDCVVIGVPLEAGSASPDLMSLLARHGERLCELPAALFWHRPAEEPAVAPLNAAPLGAGPMPAVRAQLQPVSVGDFTPAGECDAPGAWRDARRWSAQLSWTLDCACNPEPPEPSLPWSAASPAASRRGARRAR